MTEGTANEDRGHFLPLEDTPGTAVTSLGSNQISLAKANVREGLGYIVDIPEIPEPMTCDQHGSPSGDSWKAVTVIDVSRPFSESIFRDERRDANQAAASFQVPQTVDSCTCPRRPEVAPRGILFDQGGLESQTYPR